MHIFEFHLCLRIVYVITVILIPHMLNSRKKQAQKINNKILKKIIKIKRKKLPAMGLELWTFCLADQRLRPLGHNTLIYKLFLSTSIIQLF